MPAYGSEGAMACSTLDVSFDFRASESGHRNEWVYEVTSFSLQTWNWFMRSLWKPQRDYSVGRIDNYEGIPVGGTSSRFAQDFWNGSQGLFRLPSTWWQLEELRKEQFLPSSLVATPDPYRDIYDLMPGDVVMWADGFADEPVNYGTSSHHYGVVHSVSRKDGVFYVDSNRDGDGLGYMQQMDPDGVLPGAARIWPGRNAGYNREFTVDVRHAYREASVGQRGVLTAQVAGLYARMPDQVGNRDTGYLTYDDTYSVIAPFTAGTMTHRMRFAVDYADEHGHVTVRIYLDGAVVYAGTTHNCPRATDLFSRFVVEGCGQDAHIGTVQATAWGASLFGVDPPATEILGRSGGLQPRLAKRVSCEWLTWRAWALDQQTAHPSIFWNVITAADAAWVGVGEDGYLDIGSTYHYGSVGQVYYPYLELYGFYPSGSVCTTTDATHRTKIAWTGRAPTGQPLLWFRRIEDLQDAESYSTPVKLFPPSDYPQVSFIEAPCLVAYEDGWLRCWYVADGVQMSSYSRDDGRTWTIDSGATMLGASLLNFAAVQFDGITLGVGINAGNCYFCRSNDQGFTQDRLPDRSTAHLIAACSDDSQPKIIWYPDGQVTVWFMDDDNEPVCYANEDSGYGDWIKLDAADVSPWSGNPYGTG